MQPSEHQQATYRYLFSPKSRSSKLTVLKVSEIAAPHPCFTSEINRLQRENTKLGEEVSRRKEEALAEASARQHTQEKLDQLEADLCASRVLVEKLTKENTYFASKLRSQTKRLGQSDKEIKRALQALHRLGPTARTLRE